MNLSYGFSLEATHWGTSKEYTQHDFIEKQQKYLFMMLLLSGVLKQEHWGLLTEMYLELSLIELRFYSQTHLGHLQMVSLPIHTFPEQA